MIEQDCPAFPSSFSPFSWFFHFSIIFFAGTTGPSKAQAMDEFLSRPWPLLLSRALLYNECNSIFLKKGGKSL